MNTIPLKGATMSARTPWSLTLALFGALVFSVPLAGQDPDYTMTLTGGSGSSGATVDVVTTLDSSGPLAAWSLGVCHTGPIQVVAIEAGATTATVNGGEPPDFLAEVIMEDDGWTAGAIINFFSEYVLPAGPDHELHVTSYTLLEEGVGTLEICSLGAITPRVVEPGGNALTPVLEGTTITVTPGTDLSFVRGNCDGLGGVTLPDAVFLLGFLFAGGPTPDCLEACDANDEGGLNAADALVTLGHLYAGGLPPAPPYPACGIEPGAACATSTCP